MPDERRLDDLTPRQIVEELDRYVVGQQEAKRALAVALRNRYRRRQLPPELRDEVLPKNILLIGPTGVGKTELARRMALAVDAPFIKVEATKYTEVGYVGRDVESIIQDLVEDTVVRLHEQRLNEVQKRAEQRANERIVDYILAQSAVGRRGARKRGTRGPRAAIAASVAPDGAHDEVVVEPRRDELKRRQVRRLLRQAKLDDTMIEIEVTAEDDSYDLGWEAGESEYPDGLRDFVDRFRRERRRSRVVSVKEARRILTREEAMKMVDWDQVVDEACERAEQNGIVFIDELDKIVGGGGEWGSDVSGEGVQRDLLPIIEGSSVMTRYGPIDTRHMLFIAAGSFTKHKPSDLIPELQGRFPLRVELNRLSQQDLATILREPRNALTKQYAALLATEGVELVFTDDAIEEIARVAYEANERTENIGARRLQTVMERVLEDISFNAPELAGQRAVIDREYVRKRVEAIVKDEDLSRYIL